MSRGRSMSDEEAGEIPEYDDPTPVRRQSSSTFSSYASLANLAPPIQPLRSSSGSAGGGNNGSNSNNNNNNQSSNRGDSLRGRASRSQERQPPRPGRGAAGNDREMSSGRGSGRSSFGGRGGRGRGSFDESLAFGGRSVRGGRGGRGRGRQSRRFSELGSSSNEAPGIHRSSSSTYPSSGGIATMEESIYGGGGTSGAGTSDGTLASGPSSSFADSRGGGRGRGSVGGRRRSSFDGIGGRFERETPGRGRAGGIQFSEEFRSSENNASDLTSYGPDSGGRGRFRGGGRGLPGRASRGRSRGRSRFGEEPRSSSSVGPFATSNAPPSTGVSDYASIVASDAKRPREVGSSYAEMAASTSSLGSTFSSFAKRPRESGSAGSEGEILSTRDETKPMDIDQPAREKAEKKAAEPPPSSSQSSSARNETLNKPLQTSYSGLAATKNIQQKTESKPIQQNSNTENNKELNKAAPAAGSIVDHDKATPRIEAAAASEQLSKSTNEPFSHYGPPSRGGPPPPPLSTRVSSQYSDKATEEPNKQALPTAEAPAPSSFTYASMFKSDAPVSEPKPKPAARPPRDTSISPRNERNVIGGRDGRGRGRTSTGRGFGGRVDGFGRGEGFGGRGEGFVGRGDGFGGRGDPFGGRGRGDGFVGRGDPFVGRGDPFGGRGDPFGGRGDPFGGRGDPFGGRGGPFGGRGRDSFGGRAEGSFRGRGGPMAGGFGAARGFGRGGRGRMDGSDFPGRGGRYADMAPGSSFADMAVRGPGSGPSPFNDESRRTPLGSPREAIRPSSQLSAPPLSAMTPVQESRLPVEEEKTKPPSPPPTPPPEPSAPSGLVLGLTRLADMEAEMEFAYAKHMLLKAKQRNLRSQYNLLEHLAIGVEAVQDDLNEMALKEDAAKEVDRPSEQ